MQKQHRFVRLVLSLLFVKCSSENNASFQNDSSYFWIVDRVPPSFILGTVHVPYELVWDRVPRYVQAAFHSSDRLLVELDMTEPSVSRHLRSCQKLDKNQPMRRLLSVETFSKLRVFMSRTRRFLTHSKSSSKMKRSLFDNVVRGWPRKRPIWILCSLISHSLALEKNTLSPVMDHHLALQAKLSNKPVDSLESPDHQCEALNSISDQKVDEMISRFLNNTINAKKMTELIDQYNSGHLGERNFSGSDGAVWSRTQHLAGRMHEVLHAKPNEMMFFAIGAGHLINGEGSVIKLLNEMGYNVVRMTNDSRAMSKFSQPMPKRWYREIAPNTKYELEDDMDSLLYNEESRLRPYNPWSSTSRKMGGSLFTIAIVLISVLYKS